MSNPLSKTHWADYHTCYKNGRIENSRVGSLEVFCFRIMIVPFCILAVIWLVVIFWGKIIIGVMLCAVCALFHWCVWRFYGNVIKLRWKLRGCAISRTILADERNKMELISISCSSLDASDQQCAKDMAYGRVQDAQMIYENRIRMAIDLAARELSRSRARRELLLYNAHRMGDGALSARIRRLDRQADRYRTHIASLRAELKDA